MLNPMQNIAVRRYANPEELGWAGWIEPKDLSWIVFIRADGSPVIFMHRDPVTGACLSGEEIAAKVAQ